MRNARGFASTHALVIMVFAIVVGAYFLKSAAKEASTAGSYFQMRSAGAAAQAGLNAGLAQLESGPAAASILRGYLQDNSRCWLLGAAAPERAMRAIALPATSQAYAARIIAFDIATHTVKIESEGRGPGGSIARATGVYRLEGLGNLAQPPQPDYALYLAGPGRALDAPMVVDGGTYFGGAMRLAPSASGSSFNGSFKVAAALSAGATQIQGSVSFRDDAYFETPLQILGGTTVFHKRFGFDDDVILNATARLLGTGLGGYSNGTLSGGQRLDMGGKPLEHSGFLDPARVANAGRMVDTHDPIDISPRFDLPYGEEKGLAFNPANLPAGAVRAASATSLPDAFTAGQLLDYFHNNMDNAVLVGRRNMCFVIAIDKPMALIRGATAAENEFPKSMLLIVQSTLTVNGNLWHTIPISGGKWDGEDGNVMFFVPSGGSIVGLGGNDRFRGNVLVEGTGQVTYQWGPSGYMEGAVHHVSPTAGFQVLGPNPFRIRYDRASMDDFAAVGVRSPAPVVLPTGPLPQLVDTRIRPRLLGLYH